MLRIIITVFLSLIFLSGCSEKLDPGIHVSGFDKTVRPQDDIYRYVNGVWLDKTEIPADKSNYGVFTELYDKSQIDLRTIIEESAFAENKKDGSDEQKVGDFYLSYLDSNLVEKLGITPLKEELDRINAVQTREDLLKLIAYLNKTNVQVPFIIFIEPDLKQSDQYISYIHQSGLGLPDRDYYFKKDQKFNEIREKYVTSIKDIFSLAKIDVELNTNKKLKSTARKYCEYFKKYKVLTPV